MKSNAVVVFSQLRIATRCLPAFLVLVLALVAPRRASSQSVYDLRTAGPGGVSWVPAVQDQSQVGDCWSFATTTALDSNLIKNGYLPTSTTAPPIAISSWHLSAYNGAAQNTNYVSGSTPYPGISGGYAWMATSYFTRGQGSWTIPQAPSGPGDIAVMGGGPVLNANNPLNPFPLQAVNASANLAPYLPPVNQNPGFTVTKAYYFDQQGSNRTDAQQVAAVKSALLDHGALSTYMYAGGYTRNHHKEEVFNYDNSLGYEYAYNPTEKQADHAVTIIGWNDNVIIPQGAGSTQGGWIVQNSWGAWGGTLALDDGTFYVSYDDPIVGKQGVAAYSAVPAGTYSPMVMQNELGPILATGDVTVGNYPASGMGIIDAAKSSEAISRLTAETSGALLALGLTSVDAQQGDPKTVTVMIYDGLDMVDGQATWGTLLDTETFTFGQQGYSLFDLTTPIAVTQGQTLDILVDYHGSPLPYVWQDVSLNGVAAPEGLTYFYGNDSQKWRDFASLTGTGAYDTHTGIFSIKGLMAVPEIDPAGLPGVAALVMGFLGLIERRRRNSRAATDAGTRTDIGAAVAIIGVAGGIISMAATTAAAQTLLEPFVVPLQYLPTVEAGPRFGIQASIAGGSFSPTYIFDTGSPRFISAYGTTGTSPTGPTTSWWGPPGSFTLTGTTGTTYYSGGGGYVYNVVDVAVTLSSTSGAALTTGSSYDVAQAFENFNHPDWLEQAPPSGTMPPLQNYFYGTFGADLTDPSVGLYGFVNQFQTGPGITKGFVVDATSDNPTLTIGIDEPTMERFATAPMNTGTTPGAYAQFVVSSTLTFLAKDGASVGSLVDIPTLFDTGTEAAMVIYTGSSVNPPPAYSAVQFTFGDVAWLVPWTEVVVEPTKHNIGTLVLGLPFFQNFAVMYDVQNGNIGFVQAAVPEIDPAGMGSVIALVIGGLGLLERRRLRAA